MNAFTGQTFMMNQLLNIKQVVALISVSKSTIYAMLDCKSPYFDPSFPKNINISQNRVCWSAWENQSVD